MTDEGLPADRLNRILTAVETIEESLGVLTRKQQVDREGYKTDSDTRDIVERRFVKMTEAAIDIAEELVKHERTHRCRITRRWLPALVFDELLGNIDGCFSHLHESTLDDVTRV